MSSLCVLSCNLLLFFYNVKGQYVAMEGRSESSGDCSKPASLWAPFPVLDSLIGNELGV